MAACILKTPGPDGKRLVIMDHAKAKVLQGYLKHPETIPSDELKQKVDKIHAIYLGKAPIHTRDNNGNFPKTASDFEPPVQMGQQHLTHEGRLQGMGQAIPTGDQ